MNSVCCLKACHNTLLESSGARVEVRTGSLPVNLQKTLISWSATGDAVFHKTCWDIVLGVAPPKQKQKRLVLSREERKAVTQAKKTAEYYDSDKEIQSKAQAFVKLLLNAKHACVFTGAGISTSAGIGDYRGKSGKWTLEDQKKAVEKEKEEEEDEGVPYEALRPTYAHEALIKLLEMKHLHSVISQNCDGLHRMSGVSVEQLCELHGNVFIEYCIDCGARYVRDFYVLNDESDAKTCPQCRLDHLTGRNCSSCSGALRDTIVNFGDDLEEEILHRAEQHAKQCDLMLVLGSSLFVTPANELVAKATQSVIVNRQRLDAHWEEAATIRVFGNCDQFMKAVLIELLGPKEEQKWHQSLAVKRVGYDNQHQTEKEKEEKSVKQPAKKKPKKK